MTVRLLEGDALVRLAELPGASVDAVVSDPPSGIGFMNAKWDSNRGGRRQWVAWMTEVFTEVHRVMKPGAHGLVWALPRTSHWTAWALEDAGFEVRDRLLHLFGSGFPKGHDVSKAIDRMAGAEREVIGPNPLASRQPGQKGTVAHGDREPNLYITAPATDAARQWDGWNTALKPAYEDWWLIRKPLAERGVAQNVLAHGTGALNIAATRISTSPADAQAMERCNTPGAGRFTEHKPAGVIGHKRPGEPLDTTAGRWPANLLLSHVPPDEDGNGGCREVGTRRVKGAGWRSTDLSTNTLGRMNDDAWQAVPTETPHYVDADGLETVTAFECQPQCAVRLLDEQSGERKVGTGKAGGRKFGRSTYAHDAYSLAMERDAWGYGDTGTASRFYKVFPPERISDNLNDSLGYTSDSDSEVCRCADPASNAAKSSAPSRTTSIEGSADSVPAHAALPLIRNEARSTPGATSTSETAAGIGSGASREVESSALSLNTDGSGNRRAAPSQTGTRSTTPTTTKPITICQICGASRSHGTTTTTSDSESTTESSTASSNDGASDATNGNRSASSGPASRAPMAVTASPARSRSTESGSPITESGPERTTASGTPRIKNGSPEDGASEKQLNEQSSRFFLNLPPDLDGTRFRYVSKASSAERGAFNDWPTVKPLALMSWLIKLVTPPGGTILDPFCGSGSTLLAAQRLGFDAMGIDSDPHAVEIARRRLSEDAPLFAEVTA